MVVCTRCGGNHSYTCCYANRDVHGRDISQKEGKVLHPKVVALKDAVALKKAQLARTKLNIEARRAVGGFSGQQSPPDPNFTNKRVWYFAGKKYIKVGRKPLQSWEEDES